jgi:hypothetical protein
VLGGGVEVLVDQLLRFATSASSSASASACSTHSTSQSNVCSIDEPIVMTSFGLGIFILKYV